MDERGREIPLINFSISTYSISMSFVIKTRGSIILFSFALRKSVEKTGNRNCIKHERCWCLDKDRLEKAHSVLWIRIGWYAIDRLQRVKWLLKCHAKKNQRLWITDLQATSRLQLSRRWNIAQQRSWPMLSVIFR